VVGIYLELGAGDLVIRRAKGCFISLKNAKLNLCNPAEEV
jgi:hypothetical protein